jgi:PST family polysaccharide transporter
LSSRIDNLENGEPVAGAERELWRAFSRGVRNNIFAEFGVQSVRISGFIVLARALAPAEFGLLRILITVSMIATLLSSGGIPAAIIQRKELREDHEATAWWMNVSLALAMGGGLYWAAPVVARGMAMPDLATPIRLISLPVVLEGSSGIANARLCRRLEFGVLAAADVIAEIGFLAVAIGLLYLQLPHWSLVGGLGARLTIHALVVCISEHYIPRSRPSLSAGRDLLRFSFSVWCGRILCTLSANADYIMVGRLLGTTTLGLYGIAWDLLRFVPDRLHSVAGRVTLPTFCRLQDDNHALCEAYTAFTNYLGRIVLPMIGCAAVAAPDLLGGVFGARWVAAATSMRLLSIGLALNGLYTGVGAIYYAKDHPSFDIYIHSIRLALLVLVVWSLAPAGLFGVSAGMSAMESAISFGAQLLVCFLIGLRFTDWMASTLPGFRLALLCMIATMGGKMLASVFDLHGALALPIIALPPAALFCWMEMSAMRDMVGRAFVSDKIGLVPARSEDNA